MKGPCAPHPVAARAVTALALAAALGCARSPAPPAFEIEIPYRRTVLDNGLTLIVHEDPKAPIAAVNVWYHVGSKDERPGRTGFAHLFEHLMFNGSEHFDRDYFAALDRVGATETNGTTDADRTNYFQNVPSSALDVVLWLESDRMGHLLGAVTQERLDEQRGVVQNEKRQGDNQPYGRVFDLLVRAAYPAGHPYSWPTIGSMEDLEAATLEDVRDWFRTWYGAANAVLVVAGDVEFESVRRRVEAHFGHIPPGPPLVRQQVWVAKRSGEHRQVVQDRVPQARLVKAWNIPELGAADADYLDLASDVLATGKNSRLEKRLVREDQSATDVAAFAWLREIGGLFVVWATAQPGGDLRAVERALDEELARLRDEGPTPRELERVKAQQRAAFLRGIERIGGFQGKSDVLAGSEVFGGSPDFYRRRMARLLSASAAQVRDAARRWIDDGATVLEVQPFPEHGTAPPAVDRSALPEPGAPPAVTFPPLERAQLSNGLEVIVVERGALPLVELTLLVDAGYAADPPGAEGTAKLALDMLDEGTRTRSALEIAEALALLGAELRASSNLDVSAVHLSALAGNLEASLDLFADVVLQPAFPEADFERLRRQQIAAIGREKATPFEVALRVLPRLLYGEGHPYGAPFSGSGTEASVASLTREQLRAFHRTWFRPQSATLVAVGDTSLAALVPLLEERFRDWAPGRAPSKPLAAARAPGPGLYLLDRPDAPQSLIVAGHLAPPKANPDEVAIELMNEVLGGSFTARINMNLREDKHWSYGAHSFFADARGPRPFVAFAPVQTDRTADALRELRREIEDITGARPPDAEELARAVRRKTLTLPGRWETARAVGRSVAELVRFGFADDYWQRYPERVRAAELAALRSAAREVLHPERLTWVVIGDRRKIEPALRAAGLGELQLLDADGRPAQ